MRSPAEEFALLRESVESLKVSVSALTPDPAQQTAVEKLYEELKLYRDDFVAASEKPLLLDLLMLYDSFHWFHQSLVKQDSSPEVIADAFQYLVDELLEVLYRRDVVPMEPAERFDRTHHKAMQIQPAATEEDDNRIARTLKRGFLRRSQVLRPEEVVVSRFKGSSS
jgi:molecular chaperone GrpE (heat shock protein)